MGIALNGKRILITRSAEQAAVLCDALARLDAKPVVVPTIEIVEPGSYIALDQAIADLDEIDYLVLTSTNAVQAFFARLAALGHETSSLDRVQIVAVGPKSAQALAGLGIQADLVPDDYRAEGVVALLKDRVARKRILYPKAALARDLIPTELRAAGAEVVDPVAYTSAPPADAAAKLCLALDDGLDLLTFTASSTVQNFVDLLDCERLELAKQIPVASIGPLTTVTAESLGFKVLIEPDNSTLDDMVKAIRDYFETRDA